MTPCSEQGPLRHLAMVDTEHPEKPDRKPKPPSIDELRKMVREDIKEQRKLIDRLRRKMN